MPYDFGNDVLPERFWKKVAWNDMGCWVWTGTQRGGGYGCFWRDGKQTRAHRSAYEAFVGPIPSGLQIDHLCRNRACVNPRHMEAVTPRENTLRGDTFQARNADRTHCPRGHEYAGANLLVKSGGRRDCRMCKNERARDKYAATRAAIIKQRS